MVKKEHYKTVRVSEKLHQQLKVRAAEEGKTLEELVKELLERECVSR